MTFTLEQKVNEFVEKIKMLRTASDAVLALQYATEATKEENTAVKIGEIYQALAAIYQKLIHSLRQSLLFDQSDISADHQLSIRNNINSVIKTVANMPDSSIPAKEELVEILQLCSLTLDEKELSDLIKNLRTDQEQFHQQIVMLSDLCLLDL